MTTPNLEQIALTVMRAMHDNDTFQPYPEVMERAVQALRSVAPQPAKTEEVRRAVLVALDKADAERGWDWKHNDHIAGIRSHNADYIMSALAPYLRTDREPCMDTVRLDWLESEAHTIEVGASEMTVVRGADGHKFTGDTLRAAIDQEINNKEKAK